MKSMKMKIEIKELNRALNKFDGYVTPFAMKGWEKFTTTIFNYIFRILDYKHRKGLYFKQIQEVVESFEEEITIIITDMHPQTDLQTNEIFLPKRNCFFNDSTRAFVLAHEFMHIVHHTIEDTQYLESYYAETVANSGAFFLLKYFDLVDISNIYAITSVLSATKMELKKQIFKKALEIGYICAEKALEQYEITMKERAFYNQFLR